jgi:RNA polymerase sigma-70 factor (ECF subfamily)
LSNPSHGRLASRAVNELLAQYAPRLYRFALRLARDPATAEDLAQEALLRAWRGRARLRDERSVRGWLFQIVVNLWRDHLRRRSTLDEELAEPSAVVCPERPQRALEERELVEQALAALDELPQRQREVLYLHACEGLSIAEVAQALDSSPDAVKASLCLARKRMRARLGHLFPERQWT